MSIPENEHHKKEKVTVPVERDVLGLEKPTGNGAGSSVNPKLIFIGLAAIILAIIVFWLVTNH